MAIMLHYSKPTCLTIMHACLAPGGDCEGSAIGAVCLYVCQSERVTQKLFFRLTYLFTQEGVYPWFGPVLSDRDPYLNAIVH